MNLSRIGRAALVTLALSLGLLQAAHAEVRGIRPTQALPKPTNPSYPYFGLGVAIDGPFIIVLAISANDGTGTYAALLYRRNLSDGKWVYRKTLVTATGSFVRTDVRMKGGIAAVQFGGKVSLFEHANGDYVPARVVAPIVHPGGLAISNGRVLVGGNGCDDDGQVYEKGSDGRWGITGRLNDHTGECAPEGLSVELNYNYAIVHYRYGTVAQAWRRTGPSIDWVPAGTLTSPPGVGVSDQPFTLQYATAVANSGYAYVRNGNTWDLTERATSVDADNANRITFETIFRDGVLLASEAGNNLPFPRVYLETSPGRFEHVASLLTSDIAWEMDLSGRTAVSVVRNAVGDHWDVEVFTLPGDLHVPPQIVNDFEDRNASDFQTVSGSFQLATRGSNDVLAQGAASGLAVSLATPSDWTDYQRIESDIAPTLSGADSWVGLVARYVDANNYYSLAIRAGGQFTVSKRVNGVSTVLSEGTAYVTNPRRISLVVEGSRIFFSIDGEGRTIKGDDSLTHGRAGLATWQARSDFDDVQVAGAGDYILFDRDWQPFSGQFDIDLTTAGGNWHVNTDEESNTLGMSQSDKSGDARAYTGVPVANQEITTLVRLDSFGTSAQGTWFGLLARYVDANNHYYVTVRSTGQIQIRKKVNGVITVLGSANFVPTPRQNYELRFRVINDQLQLFVDGALVASAHDTAIASGQYGLATYRTAATYEFLSVFQP